MLSVLCHSVPIFILKVECNQPHTGIHQENQACKRKEGPGQGADHDAQ